MKILKFIGLRLTLVLAGSLPLTLGNVASAAATESPLKPTCHREAIQAAKIIARDFGLTKAKIKIDGITVCGVAESQEGIVKITAATRSALQSFLTDHTDIESPLAIAIAEAFQREGTPESETVPPEILQSAQNILKEHLKSPQTTIELIRAGNTAEHGEASGPNWIFRMTSKGLSDHIFWAIVDRSGAQPVYNYGFN